MSKHDLQSEKLDKIGRSLLKAARVSDEEIENIVAAPELLDSVLCRIKAEKLSHRKPKLFFDDWTILTFFNQRKAIGAFAILMVLLISAAVITFKKQDLPQIVEQTIRPGMQPKTHPAEHLLLFPEIKKAKVSKVKNQANSERTAFKIEKSRLLNRGRKRDLVIAWQGPKKQPPEVFYSLAVGRNWEESGEDLQIVRAEISRSELFALGINLSVENESAKVKTDLLVGADGLARAFRFVE